MKLHGNHRARLRKRYEKSGLDDFEDHVILELLLFQSIPRRDTNPLAHRLLDQFGSLLEVLKAPEDKLLQVKGVGKVTARMLNTIYGQMLFRILDGGASSDAGVERLAFAAEWHMRFFPNGAASVFSEQCVIDYVSDDGNPVGLGDLILRDAEELKLTKYAVVVQWNGADEPPAALREELSRFPFSYRLAERRLTKL